MSRENDVLSHNEEHEKSARQERAWMKVAGWIAAGACLLWIGWMARGLMPPPEQEEAVNPMMAMMRMPGLVQVEVVSNAVVNPPYTYIGRVEAIRDVSLRAQVAGMVRAVRFAEGSKVKAGDVLFEIEPEQYAAVVAARKAEVAQAQAGLERAESLLARLEAADRRAVTEMDVDTARADVSARKAGLELAKAGLALAEIDLNNTRIVAPVDGQVGRTMVNVGDYVTPGAMPLVRIVQMDPIRVAFSVTDREFVEARENVADAQLQDTFRARVRLPTGTIPDMTGERDFEDNVMSEGTASVSVRVRFPNERRLLVPGGYVTMLVDLLNPTPYPTVPRRALKTDGHGAFVFVLGEGNMAARRDVVAGAEADGRVAIKSGLNAGERVIVEGFLNVMPGRPLMTPEQMAAAMKNQGAPAEKPATSGE